MGHPPGLGATALAGHLSYATVYPYSRLVIKALKSFGATLATNKINKVNRSYCTRQDTRLCDLLLIC